MILRGLAFDLVAWVTSLGDRPIMLGALAVGAVASWMVKGSRQFSQAELNSLPFFVRTDVIRRYVLHFLCISESLLLALLRDVFRSFVYFVGVFARDADLILKRLKWLGMWFTSGVRSPWQCLRILLVRGWLQI